MVRLSFFKLGGTALLFIETSLHANRVRVFLLLKIARKRDWLMIDKEEFLNDKCIIRGFAMAWLALSAN